MQRKTTIKDILKHIDNNATDQAISEIQQLDLSEINTRDKSSHKQTLLDAACSKGQLAVVSALLERGANINLRNDADEFYPLHNVIFEASSKKDIEERLAILALFKEKKADFTVEDGAKRSALQIASTRHNFCYLQPLLNYGTNINHKDRDGETIRDYASKSSRLYDIKDWLSDNHAKSGFATVSFEERKKAGKLTIKTDDGTIELHRRIKNGKPVAGDMRVAHVHKHAPQHTVDQAPKQNATVQEDLTASVSKLGIYGNARSTANLSLVKSMISYAEKSNSTLFAIFLNKTQVPDLDELMKQMPDLNPAFLEKVHARKHALESDSQENTTTNRL